MENRKSWDGLPYYPINQYYKKIFNTKVYKVPVSLASTCPNRERLKGMKPCIFCDEWGSAAYPENRDESLKKQILINKETVSKRNKAYKFLIYFQSYTNTFLKTMRLRESFEQASSFEDVYGFVVATRPDCLSHSLFELLNEYSKKFKIFIELGVQSFNNRQLKWMERGHSREKSIEAIYKIQEKCPKINLGIHLMFGLPWEDTTQIIETAALCSSLKLNNVKLHNLHVLKNTPLEEEYEKGNFHPIEKKVYAERVKLFLQHLSPTIAIHRLVAVASRHDELVAPRWVGYKMSNYQYMIEFLEKQNAFQGQFYKVQ